MRLGVGLSITLPRQILSSGPAPYVPPYLEADLVLGYSTRLLHPGYAGSCLRVRRVSDNVEQDIGFSSGILDAVALASFLGASEGRVVTWYDQAGLRDRTNTTAAGQPQILSSGSPSGRPAAQFFADGDYDVLSGGVPLAPGDYILCAAASWDGTASNQFVAGQARTGFPGIGFTSDGSMAAGTGETLTNAAVPVSVGWSYASALIQSAGTEDIIVGASAVVSGTGTSWSVSDTLRLGATRTTGSNAFRGRLAEFVWLNAGRTESVRRSDIANMTAFFGA